MRHYSEKSFTTKEGRLWWNPSLLSRSGSIDCQFEDLQIEAIEYQKITGGMDCALEVVVCDMQATTPPVTADLAVSAVEFIMEAMSGLAMVCDFVPFEYESSFYIEGEDMDNCIFEELTFLGVGDYTFVSLDMQAKKLECVMGSSLGLELEFGRMTLQGNASVGTVGSIDVTAMRPGLSMKGGGPPNMDCSLEEPTLVMGGVTEILSSLSVTFRRAGWDSAGKTSVSASLSARLNLMSAQFAGTIGPVGSVSMTFIPLVGSLEAASQEISAELDATFLLLRLRAEMLVDGPNDFVVEFPNPDINIDDGGGESGSLCDLADTLVYGG